MAIIGPTNATLINGTPFNDIITGGSTNQRINGLGGHDTINGLGGHDTLVGGDGNDGLLGDTGNDRLFGGNGNDGLFGGTGNDRLFGGNGNDRLVGVYNIAANPGQGEVDSLTGGFGSDTFVLGDADKIYYDDGNLFSTGTNDYALITDFQAGQDTIQLKGGVNYRLQNVNLGGDISGRGIYVDNPGLLPDELIGVIQGIQPFTPLNINNGLNITTITGLGFGSIV